MVSLFAAECTDTNQQQSTIYSANGLDDSLKRSMWWKWLEYMQTCWLSLFLHFFSASTVPNIIGMAVNKIVSHCENMNGMAKMALFVRTLPSTTLELNRIFKWWRWSRTFSVDYHIAARRCEKIIYMSSWWKRKLIKKISLWAENKKWNARRMALCSFSRKCLGGKSQRINTPFK